VDKTNESIYLHLQTHNYGFYEKLYLCCKGTYVDLLLEVVATEVEVCKSAWHKLVEGQGMGKLVHPFGRQATVRQV
jgi:hypothetical protein